MLFPCQHPTLVLHFVCEFREPRAGARRGGVSVSPRSCAPYASFLRRQESRGAGRARSDVGVKVTVGGHLHKAMTQLNLPPRNEASYMPTDAHDAIKANIILIGIGCLTTPDEVRSFSDAVGTEVVQTETGVVLSIPQGPIEAGRKLELHRERVSLELLSTRTVIERGYPARDDLARLAEVAGCAFDCTVQAEGVPTAFGYNLENDLQARLWSLITSISWLAFVR